MKRFIAALLAVLTLISVIPVSVSAEADMPFNDVKSTHWFYDAAKYCYENSIISGTSDTKFSPNLTLTRGTFVTLLFRLSGVDQEQYTGETVFTDVAVDQWYAKAVQWANEKGYVAGMSPTTFKPNGKITRAQMARILALYAAGEDNYDLTDVRESAFNKFADAAKVQSWAKEGITWMSSTGLISGMGTQNGGPVLNPNGTATRAQAAQILMGYMEYYNGEYPVGSLTLGDTDLSEFVIVLGETSFDHWETEDCEDIAAFLNGQFKAALGYELPVYRDTEHPYVKGSKEILIGKTNREGSAISVDREGIDHNTYIYEMQGDHLILASSEEMYATHYAATMFLEDILGITYYGLDRFGYTNMKSAHIADGTRVVESMDFKFVSNFQHGGDDYFLGSFNENDVFVNSSHNLNALGCTDTACPYYYENTISYGHHLEHYLGADPCFTSDEVIDKVIENVRLNLEEEIGDNKDAYVYVWLNQDDLGDYCKCDNCRLVYTLWGRSAPYVQILTYVSEALSDEYPNVTYFSFSYRQTATAPKTADQITDAAYEAFVEKYKDHKYIPPKDITPPDNCVVMVKTDDTGCSSHARNDLSCERNAEYLKRFEGWCDLFDNVCLHHFMEGDVSPHSPFPNVYEVWEDFNFISAYPQVKWIRTIGGFGDASSDFCGMRAYLVSRLYWDKEMTRDQYSALIDGYLEAVYSDGWTYIREYIDTLEELSSKNCWWTYNSDVNHWNDVITEEQWRDGGFEYCKALIEKAVALSEPGAQSAAAKRLSLQTDYIECQLAYSAGLDSFPSLCNAFVQKLTELGFETPTNMSDTLDPDEWIYE